MTHRRPRFAPSPWASRLGARAVLRTAPNHAHMGRNPPSLIRRQVSPEGSAIQSRDEASSKWPARGPGKRASDTDVALVIKSLESGGAQRVVTILANARARRGFRVAVVTMAPHDTDFFTLEPLVARRTIGRVGRARGLVGRQPLLRLTRSPQTLCLRRSLTRDLTPEPWSRLNVRRGLFELRSGCHAIDIPRNRS